MTTTIDAMPWWHGHTVKCDGCRALFPALDDVAQVVTVQGDPCGWHRGFLEAVTDEQAAARWRSCR
jgi:hypothetical protein